MAAWHGSTAGGAAGKGPVRGYPPLPGQPPPMYPPGQFSAWNRGHGGGQSRPGPAARPAGPERAGPRSQHESPRPGRPAGSGYFGDDDDSEPGYSMLAVSDPAADVTSTQTWRAEADGRATGTWSAPAGARQQTSPGGAPRPGAHARPAPGGPVESGSQQAGPGGRRFAPWSPQAAAARAARQEAQGRAGAPAGQAKGSDGAASRPASDAASVSAAVADRGRAQARGRRKHPFSVYLAVAGAVVLVCGAAAALYYGARAFSGSHPNSKPPAGPATVAPTPTLGPYGHIGSRQSDPVPLTIAQLYPKSFTATADTFVQTGARISADCIDAVSGAGVQAAVSAGGCSQVARATYIDAKAGMMGTIGVLNLRTAAAALKAARAASANNFISQLPGRKGPTHKIGQGTGIEEAAAKGHYLILIWAELTNLRAPRTPTERSGLEAFMTELLQATANVSLSNRMVNGGPA